MKPVSREDIKEIIPYDDSQFVLALERVRSHPAVLPIAKEFFSTFPIERLREKADLLKTIRDFQAGFIDPLLKGIEQRATSGLTIGGLESLAKDGRFLYLCNHRDIFLDSAFFTVSLFRNGFATPQICLGDNLLTDSLIVDLVKMNKGITVKRGLPPRELLRWSYVLSFWIREVITQGKDSVWIAQHEGRCKDGNDVTHPGVIKMLALGSDDGLIQRLGALHIVPVAISYEYDPNDVEKALELHFKETHGSYQKKPGEDISAGVRGVRGQKGGVYIQVGEEIKSSLAQAESLTGKSEQVRFIASEIDTHIHRQYHNWPSNYIAHDLLSETQTHRTHYDHGKRTEFIQRLEGRLSEKGFSDLDREAIKKRVLGMYAMSVTNQLRSARALA